MSESKRRVSPRAPSLALDEALNRVVKMYKAEGVHMTPADVALRHIGYSSKNGAALAALASLGYWGLIERPRDGMVKVSKKVEDFQYTPDAEHKHELLVQFLRNPPLFATLLEKYKERLPSDGTLQYDLIQAGFTPVAAGTCLSVFKRSVDFAGYFQRSRASKVEENVEEPVSAEGAGERAREPEVQLEPEQRSPISTTSVKSDRDGKATGIDDASVDRIPIRLAGGRRAWIEIPSPFFSADRARLKKHIDLLLTDDEEDLFAADE